MSYASTGPVAVIDGPRRGFVAKYLRVVTRDLPAERLDAIQPALDALDTAAKAQRQHDRQAFAAGSMEGWGSVAEAAALAGVSERAIRAKLERGTLAGERRGKAWRVDLSELSERPA